MIRTLTHVILLGLAMVLGPAVSLTAVAQESEFKQVKLTDADIKNYIKSYSDLQGVLEKIEKAGDSPDPKLIESLEEVAKKHGFKSFDHLDDVSSTISFIVTGFDQESGEFSEPRQAMQEEIEALKEDKSIPEKERAEILKELQEAVKSTPDVEHKENIALVKKYLKELDKITN